MPKSAPKACSTPGCAGYAKYRGKCEKCGKQANEQRGTSKERGYDADYRRLRPLCFQRDEWRCVDCGWEPEIVRIYRLGALGLPPTSVALEGLRLAFNRNERHLHADHIIPIEERPELRLVLDNLATRCNECHSRKTSKESSGWVAGRVNG